MVNTSLKSRYILTLSFNILNSFLSFFTSIIIIRHLSPNEYGNYQFLFSIFVTIFTFFNLNTQNSYFTFISQKKESLLFFKNYILWELIQFIFVLLIVLFFYKTQLMNVFLDLDILLVFLALIATFCTKNIREIIVNTFESKRMTVTYLKSTFLINCINLLLIILFSFTHFLTIYIIFLCIIVEFIIYFLFSIYIFWQRKNEFIDESMTYNFKINVKRYYDYTKPLFFSSLIASAYFFLERWLLQKFGGANQQAYLAIAVQFSTIILILTTSIIKVFWKEVSEYIANQNLDKLEIIFMTVIKNIFIMTSLLSFFFIFNARDILTIIYGDKYVVATNVFILISFYTIHQTLGQLYGTFMLASETTKTYSYVSIIFSMVSIPLIFVVVAPKNLFGLNLGAQGIASVMVLIQIFSVNIMGFIIQRTFGFRGMITFQFKYLIINGFVVWLTYIVVKSLHINIMLNLFLQILCLGLIACIWYKEQIKEVCCAKK